jgi:predicted deacylase
MGALGLIAKRGIPGAGMRSVTAISSRWLRAPVGGLLRSFRTIGDSVEADEVLGVVADPFGEKEAEIRSPEPGVVIGRRNMPIVNEGDALFHIGTTAHPDSSTTIDALTSAPQPDFMLDEDEII